MDTKWDRDWVVSPGEVLREWIEERGLGVKVTAMACRHMAPSVLEKILSGERPITERDAARLATGTHIPKAFWLAFEHNFRTGLAAGKKWTP